MSILYNGTLYTKDDWKEENTPHNFNLAFNYIYDYGKFECILDECFPNANKVLLCCDGCIEFYTKDKEGFKIEH